MSTRAELRAKVLPLIGNMTNKNSVINDGLEAGLVQAMQVHAFGTRQVETDINIAEDDSYIDYPSNTLELVEARLIDGTSSHSIEIRNKKWIVEKWPDISSLSTGKPFYAYEENSKLYLYPNSNDDYKVRVTVKAKASFLDVDSTENPISSLENYLVCFATMYVLNSIKLFDDATVWEKKAATALILAIRADTRKPAEVKRFIPRGYDVEPRSPIEPSLDPFNKGE